MCGSCLLPLLSTAAVAVSVAPVILPIPEVKTDVVGVVLTVIGGAATMLLAPFVGVCALLALSVALVFAPTEVGPYGRQGEPDDVIAAPTVAVAPVVVEPVTIDCVAVDTVEVARLRAAYDRAVASRHRARAAAYLTRIDALTRA